MILVNHFLENSAELRPDKVALICGNQRYTYAEIDKMANRMAHALRDHGVGRGDRVILYLPNSVELAAAIFATLKAEGVLVVIETTTKPNKLLHIIENCRAKAIVLPANKTKLERKISCNAESVKISVITGSEKEEYAESNHLYLSFDAIQKEYPETRPGCRLIDQDLACLIYTSGTTGEPKGVMSSHSNVAFAASSIITYLENTSDDIVINVFPFSFDYGLYQLFMVFKFGGTLVLEPSYAYPAQILKTIETEKVTGFPGVPTLFAILLKMDLSCYDLSHLRYISNTAAALPPSHITKIQEKFPGVTLYSMYGLTETKRALYLPPAQLEKRPGSVGVAIPGTEVWIEDTTGNMLGPNEVGELVIRGGHVMRGYWGNPESTAMRYRPGSIFGERLCYSGDLFRMDEEGYFYFVGRNDDIIKSRGAKVAPKEVENILFELADVIEAAVIGVSDSILGQAIKAFVVLKIGSQLTERDILRHCRASLEDHMVPQIIELRETLPKNSSGKIRKTELV
jgi:amino acid adenylation domain-containing protein